MVNQIEWSCDLYTTKQVFKGTIVAPAEENMTDRYMDNWQSDPFVALYFEDAT